MKATRAPKVWSSSEGPDRDELVEYLGRQVGACDRRLRDLERDFELIPKKAIVELQTKMDEITLWAVRRRVMIEVWELVTNKVWLTQRR